MREVAWPASISIPRYKQRPVLLAIKTRSSSCLRYRHLPLAEAWPRRGREYGRAIDISVPHYWHLMPMRLGVSTDAIDCRCRLVATGKRGRSRWQDAAVLRPIAISPYCRYGEKRVAKSSYRTSGTASGRSELLIIMPVLATHRPRCRWCFTMAHRRNLPRCGLPVRNRHQQIARRRARHGVHPSPFPRLSASAKSALDVADEISWNLSTTMPARRYNVKSNVDLVCA